MMDKLIIGLALVAIGVASFLGAIELWDPGDLWRLWPLGMIVIGLASEAESLRRRANDGGWILVAFGAWLLAGTSHFLGLTYRTGFPLAVVVAGVFLVLHALVDVPAATKKENENGCC